MGSKADEGISIVQNRGDENMLVLKNIKSPLIIKIDSCIN